MRTALVIVAILAVGTVAAVWLADRLVFDRYAGQAQVAGLPAGYDPFAATSPYTGPHPSLRDAAPDTFTYPVAVGAPGPVMPGYTDTLQYPHACRTEISGFGQPLVDNQSGAGTIVYRENERGRKTSAIAGYSKDCSLATRVEYYYLSRRSGEFLPLADDPRDVEQVLLNGQRLPFIVRVEIGTINRHIYVIAVLRGPNDEAARPDLTYWNRKLIYQFRGGVGIGRRQGRIEPTYIPDRRRRELAGGYAVAYSTANQTANHYDMRLAEDTVARVKRQFIARYGTPQYTIGIGKSGGAIQQYLIGQNRPGLIDGAIALYSYPDMITQTIRILDCDLLEYYFDVIDADNPKWRTWSQRSWVEGFNASDDLRNPFRWIQAAHALRTAKRPVFSRGDSECARRWRTLRPQIANPHYNYFASLFTPEVVSQVPWTYWDNLKDIFGTDETGYARRTWDNVGVQYGLAALRNGQISVREFLALNAAIGGWKTPAETRPERYWRFAGGQSSLAELSVWSQHNMTGTGTIARPARRTAGDVAAMAAAYRAGQVFVGRLAMPVIDARHYLEPELDMHHSLQSFSARQRLLCGQGHADNQLIWVAAPPSSPTNDALVLMTDWLDKLHANPNLDPVQAKPPAAADRCYAADGHVIASGAGVWDGVWNGRPDGVCMQRFPIYRNPRIVAGDDYAGDIFKCHLQPVDDAIAKKLYAPVDMGPYRDTLARIFPDGVCDYPRGDAARPPDLFPDDQPHC